MREPTARTILGLAIPALGTLLSEPLLGLLDTAFVGRLGAPELAALGAANAILGLLAASLIFLEYGTTARLARRFGAGDRGMFVREAAQVGWLATGLGLGLTAVLWFGVRPLLRLVDVSEAVLEPAVTYLSIRALASVAGLWLRAGNGVFRGLQDTRTPFVIVVAMHAVNGVLDWILIFGWPAVGIPAFGIAGAAWASVAASWGGALAFAVLLVGRLRDGGSVAGAWRPRLSVLRGLVRDSTDLLLRSLGLQAALFAGTRMAAAIGTASLAAHQIGWQLWAALALLLDSLAIAGQVLIGRLLGEERADDARRVGDRLCVWGVGLGVVLTALFLALRAVLPRIFTSEPAVLAAVDSIFLLLAVMQIPNAVLFVIDGLLIGASDMRFLRNSMIALGLFGVGTAWLGGTLGGDLRGVWLGIAAWMIARLVVMTGRWRRDGWRQSGRSRLSSSPDS